MAPPLDEAPDNLDHSPRGRPNRIVALLRVVWTVVVAALTALGVWAPPDETRNDWDGYPRRKPNPIIALVRFAWGLIILALIVGGLVALYGMLEWWNVPILLAFAFAVFVLFRNRWRRANP